MKAASGVLLRALATLRRRALAAGDPAAFQERVLLGMVRESAGTSFGREHDFTALRSAADFLARVPPREYAHFGTYLDAILAGAPDVLHPGRPRCFGTTSGTSGAPKLVPLTRRLLECTRRSALDAALLSCKDQVTPPRLCGRTLFIGPRRGHPLGRWTVYPEGTAFSYLHALNKLLLPHYADLPAAGERPDFDRLAGLARRYRIGAVAGSPLEIAAFAQASGTALRSVRRVFNCGYWAEDLAPVYRTGFPNAAIVDTYGTSEGTYGLPDATGQFLLNYRRVFFSFLPPVTTAGDGRSERRRPVALSEVEVRKKYQLCVSVPGGWWNYLTGDLVSFSSLRPPVIRLHGRLGRSLALDGDLCTEDEVVQVVRGCGATSRRYLLASEIAGSVPTRRFVLFIDGEDLDARIVDSRLSMLNDAYRMMRAAGALGPLRVCPNAPPDVPGKPPRIKPADSTVAVQATVNNR